MSDDLWMHRALELALRGTGRVSPNPRVGCVIVHDETVIAEGWHDVFGGPHAEAHALSMITSPLPADSTLYVNLEPCSHVGKTPPCTQAIINSGIRRVVIGIEDPNPQVRGSGIAQLRHHGIDVITNVLHNECSWINRFFVKHITSRQPYVILKCAQSINGLIASEPKIREDLTGVRTRSEVHGLRAEVDAVLVGIGTIRIDDPLLTVRDADGRDPIRVILDARAELPLESNVVRTASTIPTVCMISEEMASSARAQQLIDNKVDVIGVRTLENGRVDLEDVLRLLGARGIASVLSEAGPTVANALLSAQLVDELRIHTAPMLRKSGKGLEPSFQQTNWTLQSCHTSDNDVIAIYLPQR